MKNSDSIMLMTRKNYEGDTERNENRNGIKFMTTKKQWDILLETKNPIKKILG